ncbi:P-loop NTPase [Ilumatobacter nonamiensis]|uniref:P-loop NTPase n=1 Tax=Ilumatobacter nonamiensis TaxID=467093 RepID=UPI0003491E31|nr:P-loop NTPase [Ilumatobacter nonamiensis]
MTDSAAGSIAIGTDPGAPAAPDSVPRPEVSAPDVLGEDVDETAIMNALRGVIDPELGDNIVDLGMVKRLERGADRAMHVTIALTTAGCPLRAQLMRDAKARVVSLPDIDTVKIHFGEMTSDERKAVMNQARWKARDNALDTDIPATARILAISSGKGGVGKSSVTANIAVLLADRGYTVGVLDADVGGFSMPHLLGIDGEIEGERAGEGKTVMKPVVREIGDGVLHIVSMGSIAGANETEAIMWRGMMLNRAVQHFLEDVQWGALDYLLIDMPPGTSDIQMGLARMLPRTDVVIVTTPAKAAQQVAARAADMARKGFLRVAGVIENMGPVTAADGTVTAMFGSGGGQHLADSIGVPLLGSIPLDAGVAAGGDSGLPVALDQPDNAASAIYRELTDVIIDDVAPPVAIADCSLRGALTRAGADIEGARERAAAR